MARVHFDAATTAKAFARQGGRCARCGKHLLSDERPRGQEWDAHHGNGDNSDTRLGQCILVCVPRCHLEAHDRRTNGPAVLSHDSFRFRNEGDQRPERRRASSGRARLVAKADPTSGTKAKKPKKPGR